ncbi:DNA gyrase subunit A [Hymenobacter negativus]|uniref:DNA gyrase subunit A n=1 Tax=Hymenobacter negativus TaxID=2795026 RepID=A0ABS0Q370_9BACT|nr:MULTISPECIES: DNA gyrase subunit A [Bacteria]MBH8557100.1 DNA gyrase subunit A [Hymenobacter negativus]MBH8569393.1 DNA gyrase subunit A [Hymenobacter negativus]MBR7209128.1 DNA gyrase subunit A [Microvirga sp. STS02]
MAEGEKIIPINIEDEMRGAYIDYSMSVIISRALPDVRDGLKPVHRRVLYGMSELGVGYNKSYKKSARIVGEVLGKYHPHGDSSVYDTMVRMAQDWSLRYPLVDGQGNFGSVDGDSPAAMRYTEARLKRIADEMLGDLDKDTVDFQPNFDDSLEEPSVLPAKFPNLLVNGTSGIAVGMATNMAPHNMTEVVSGIIAYLDNPDITVAELMQHVTAPDFPTGGIIYGYEGVKQAFETGRGRVVMRAKHTFETSKTGKDQIVITEIPYMVNKAAMIEKIAGLVNDKVLEGISDLRDESDRDGMRIVFDLKKDAMASVVLNNLFKKTQLQSSFGVNNVCLVKGRPMTLNLQQLIHYFVEHRAEVIVRRTRFELAEAQKRAHILEGLLIALDHLDEVIALIRGSRDPEVARGQLIERFALSEIQARAILDMRLQRLTGLERDKIVAEYNELMKLIDYLKSVLESEVLQRGIIKTELEDIRERYGDARRTEINYIGGDFSTEDMIADEAMVITISREGYIKRTNLDEYRAQGRGGAGSRGAISKKDDFTEHLFVATTHEYLLFFTELGRVFWLKVYEVPEGGKATKGLPLQNLIEIPREDKVRSVLNVRGLKDPDYLENTFLMFCTEQGTVKKTPLEAYSRPRTAGINAITINEGDRILDVQLLVPNSEVILASRTGRAVRFNESEARSMGRAAAGVRGIRLEDVPGNRVVGMVCVADPTQELLVVSENGFGKRSQLEEYRVTKRGGKGVRAMKITEKTGNLVAIKDVNDSDDLMIINKSGITIRLRMSDLRTIGRATQGVRLIKISGNDEISSVAKVAAEEKEEETEAALLATTAEAGALGFAALNSADNEVVADEADEADETDDELEEDSDDEDDSDDESESDDLA